MRKECAIHATIVKVDHSNLQHNANTQNYKIIVKVSVIIVIKTHLIKQKENEIYY